MYVSQSYDCTDFYDVQAVSKEYMKCNAYCEMETLLEFESDKISLDIPEEIHEGRWKIIPLTVPAEVYTQCLFKLTSLYTPL